MADDAAFALSRRSLLAGGAATIAGAAPVMAQTRARATPMVDTHIHLFDPTRPQGAPYRGPKTAVSYATGASPALYRQVMRRHPVVAAIHVDASPWVEDNLWALQQAARDPIMVGVIGNFRIEAPDFAEIFTRHAKDPLLRGLRYGNLWRYDIVAQARQSVFIDGLKRVADADLVLDTANPRLDLLQAVVRISDAVPHLRVVIDHLCKFDPAPAEMAAYDGVLREMAARPNLFVKLSSSLHAGHVSPRMIDHKARLDQLFETFGAGRVLFASDWPNVEGDGPVDVAIAIVQDYFALKSAEDRRRFFWGNAIQAYKWAPRTAAQRALFG
ncbi:amidohydrolase family protein [Sphingobium algorifonticola]|uniref:Amidohydrolase n=1 Tax=Sphingobium algorifonticola TaxID=2008318 RepID=A0A437JBB4_9SPHN|nr:amidohydrolase family protein [Sphingobium algorifonticola]RVT43197.1 amidohydrolase [Sphingobium algorifonticola]